MRFAFRIKKGDTYWWLKETRPYNITTVKCKYDATMYREDQAQDMTRFFSGHREYSMAERVAMREA